MFTRQVKRIVSSVLASTFVFSIVGFIHDEVKADTFVELDQMYSVTESDYGSHDHFQNSTVLYTFIPEETGYYSYQGTTDLDFFVQDNDGGYDLVSDCYNSGVSVGAINLPNLFQDSWYSWEYELEAGTTYYLIRTYFEGDDNNTGEFCIRKITDYVAARAVAKDIKAVKDDTFTCSISLESTIPYDSVTYSWVDDYGAGESYGSTIDPEMTFSSNNVIDFDNSTYVDSGEYEKTMCCYIDFSWPDSVTSGPRELLTTFDIYPYSSAISGSVWVDISHDVNGWFEYHNIDSNWYKDQYYQVDAGSYSGEEFNISYQWYKIDTNKDLAGETDKSKLYIPLENETSNKFYISHDTSEPYTFAIGNIYYIYKDFVCVVTFDNGNETVQIEKKFRLYYHTQVDFLGDRNIQISKGDPLSLTVDDRFSITDLPAGITYNYYWINLKDIPDPEISTRHMSSNNNNVWDMIDEDYEILSDSSSTTVDSSTLTWFDEDGIQNSYVACVSEPCYNGNACLGYSAAYGYTIFKITDMSSLSFENSVWAESEYESSSVTYPGTYEGDQLFSINAGSYLENVDVSYQWYKVDYDKEKSGNYSEEDCLIPLSGCNKSELEATKKLYNELGEPYFAKNANNSYSLFIDLACVVTFTKGNETAQKVVRVTLEYCTSTWFNGNKEVYINRTDKLKVPEAFSNINAEEPAFFRESATPDYISYRYTWIGLSSIPEQMQNDYWSAWQDVWENFDDYVVLGQGKTATLDTSNLPLFDYGEAKVSYIACVYEPIYNGNPCISKTLARGYIAFRIGYYDLVTPDTTGVAVNKTNFPDTVFRQYITDNIDKNHSGYLTDSEISKVEELYINDLNISDLTGIKYFTSLFALNCNANNLTSLDVSGMPELGYLYCNGNNLTSLNITNCNLYTLSCSRNSLSSLNLTGMNRLTYLYCSNNNIKTLNLSEFTSLEELDCSNNGLNSLNISGCQKLRELCISGNNINSIDLSLYPTIKYVYENYPHYMIADRVSGYGSYGYNGRNNEFWIYYGIQLDDSTQVLNATPSTKVTELNVVLTPVENGIKVSWDAVDGAISYEVDHFTSDENSKSYYYETTETFIIDENVEDGVEYFYTIYAYNESYQNLVLMKEPVSIYYGSGTPLKINTQPVDFTGPVGELATFTVEAQGDGLKYQWQYSKDGITWKNSNSAGYNTPSMTVKITETRDGQQYRCIVTDSNNRSVTSSAAKIIVEKAVKITSDPIDFTGPIGTYAKFTVEAAGENLTYQWQYKNAKGVWKNSNSTGYNTATMKVKVTEARDGQKYRCIVTSGETSVTSGEAAIHVEKPTVKITSDPSDVTGPIGTYAKFTVVAEGENLTYQWQYMNSKGVWNNSNATGYNTATMKVKITEARDGQKYRCIVTSGETSVTSGEAAIHVEKPTVKITSDPSDVTGPVGTYAVFTVEAEGDEVTYQWQYKPANGSWKNSNSTGYNTASMKIKISDARNGQQYRCIVTDKYNNEAISNAASIIVAQPKVTITGNPQSYTGAAGKTATFTVTAEGEGLTYQWQYSKNGTTWNNSSTAGYDTASLSIKATDARNGQMYRCIVTDKYGNTETSGVASITIQAQPKELKITSQPESYTGAVGTKATFTVAAEGEGLTYQWQYKSASSSTWSNSTKDGYNTPSMTVKVTDARNGQMYQCVITDSYGNTVTTVPVTITVG